MELKIPVVNDKLLYYLDICARCGACSDACHLYSTTKECYHAPAYRMELLRRVYRWQYTKTGRVFPRLFKTRNVQSKEFLEEFRKAAFECTGCRRCTVFCPFGVDMGAFVGLMRSMLYEVGEGDEILDMLADTAISKGEMVDEIKASFIETVKKLEDKLRRETGGPNFSIPVEAEGARVLYVALAGEHSIIPAAKIFNKVGENWTLSLFEASNYGYFTGQIDKAKKIVERVLEEAERLGVEVLAISECGHAYRVFKHLAPVWFEDFDFEVKSVVELAAEYVEEGKLQIKEGIVEEPITYHDPCQLARNGGVVEEPRKLLKILAKDFRELQPNGEKNWCCGGGGGLVAIPELYELRMKTGKPKALQVKRSGAKIVATACENCKLQLKDLNNYYDLGIKIVGVIDLVAEAI